MKMGKFRMNVISIAVAASLLFSGTAFAQEEDLPDPGITPDSPFYFLDNMGKKIGLMFTFNNEAKAQKALQYAEERLAEANAMALKNKLKEVNQAAGEYDQYMAMVNERIQAAVQENASANISERVALRAARHLAVMDRVRDRVPEENREALDRARERSLDGQLQALRALAQHRPERATEINLNNIENRLQRALEKARENATDEVEEALDDSEKLRRFGEEISEIARGLSDNTTTVDELVAKATAVHLEVLARVHEKVPETAREAIENAMANALQNREQIIERLRSRAALGDIAENITGEQVQAEVWQRVQNRVQKKLQQITDNRSAVQIQEKVREQMKEQVQEKVTNLRPQAPVASSDNGTGLTETESAKVRVHSELSFLRKRLDHIVA